MTKHNDSARVSFDEPLTNPQEDQLGVTGLADNIARAIAAQPQGASLVAAIYGPWGSGKSTLLNFVLHHLEEHTDPKRQKPLRFNPWWYSGDESLLKGFFEDLLAHLGKSGKTTKKVRKALSKLAEVVASAPLPHKGIVGAAGKLVAPRDQTLEEIKRAAEKYLRRLPKPVVVVVDDVDRLTRQEIATLFRIVKSVANLPNLIYLMAFSREVVAGALSSIVGDGEEYLDKIVQIPFDLPEPSEPSLRKLLVTGFNRLLTETPQELVDSKRWYNLYFDGASYFLRTPRNITRLLNALSVTYPPLAKEVNAADFFAMECLRLFCPVAYRQLRQNSERFLGAGSHYGRTSQIEEERSFHDAWLDRVPEDARSAVKEVLMRLFPRLKSTFTNIQISEGFETEWRRDRRVASQAAFPIFVAFSVPPNSLANETIAELIESLSNRTESLSRFRELASQKFDDGVTAAGRAFEALEDFVDELSGDQQNNLFHAIFEVGDDVMRTESDPRHFGDLGVEWQLLHLLSRLLGPLEPDERLKTLISVIRDSPSVAVAAAIPSWFYPPRRQGKPAEEGFLPSEAGEQLGQAVLDKIRAAASAGELVEAPQLRQIILEWKEQSGSIAQAKEWVSKALGHIGFAPRLTADYVTNNVFISSGDRIEQTKPTCHWDLLQAVADLEGLHAVLESVDTKELPPRQAEAVKLFLNRDPAKEPVKKTDEVPTQEADQLPTQEID